MPVCRQLGDSKHTIHRLSIMEYPGSPISPISHFPIRNRDPPSSRMCPHTKTKTQLSVNKHCLHEKSLQLNQANQYFHNFSCWKRQKHSWHMWKLTFCKQGTPRSPSSTLQHQSSLRCYSICDSPSCWTVNSQSKCNSGKGVAVSVKKGCT